MQHFKTDTKSNILLNIDTHMKISRPKRGKSHNSSKDSSSLDRMVHVMRKDQHLIKFNVEKEMNEKNASMLNQRDIVEALFELEGRLYPMDAPTFNPLESHQITKEYRTKMVDWMVEVCTSFRCSERTWFLAVSIFDRYLAALKGRKVLKNADVHTVGIVSMYLASKYEDVIPINSFIAYEKISHRGIS